MEMCDYVEVYDNTTILEKVCTFENGKLQHQDIELPPYFDFF
jgi:hypothetical protein